MGEISQFVGVGDCDVALLVFDALDAPCETHGVPILPQFI